MSEPRFDKVSASLPDTWTAERAALVGQQLHQRLRRRKRATRVAMVAGAALTLALGVAFVAAPRRVEPRVEPRALRFADGSTAEPLGTDTALVTVVDRPEATTVRLERGAARFVVERRPQRTFRVEVPPVVVEVVGTRFEVELQEHHVRVAVEEGHVRVFNGPAETQLTGGQAGLFPLAVAAREPATALPLTEAAPPPEPTALPVARPDWRPLANRGEFEKAFEVLKRSEGSPVPNDPKELLLASDVARLSGHPEQARAWLNQLLERFPHDARAPLAAFTLGRVLLDELGWPKDAALAFARARGLDPSGPLAEDALAREVEAWARAGDADKARLGADRYLETYPNGQRTLSVRRYGGY